VVYGRDPPALLSYEQGQSRVPAVDKQLVARDEFLAEIKERLLHAQAVIKGNYDAHHRQVEFQGDWVWLRLHHRIAATLTDKAKGKLAPNFMAVQGAGTHRCIGVSSGTTSTVPHPQCLPRGVPEEVQWRSTCYTGHSSSNQAWSYTT
jgi:hypothetical protein